MAENGETATLKELLEAGEDGTLGLYHERERVEERIEEEFFSVGLRWGWNGERVRRLENGRRIHQLLR